MDIIAINDIGVPLHLRHDLILPHNTLQHGVKMFFDAGFVKTIAVELIDFAVVFRDGDHFQSSSFCRPEKLSLNFIDRSEASCSDFLNGPPAGK